MEKKRDEQVDILLSRILSGTANVPEIKEFADWLKDIDNERYFENFKEIWHVAGDVKVDQKQLDVSMSKFLGVIRKKRKKEILRHRVIFSISAAAIILLLFGLFRTYDSDTFTGIKFSKEPIKIELADGSVINPLKDNSAGVNINPSNRREISYNEIQKNPSQLKDSLKYNTVTIPPGERFAIILSDGTKVYLNSNSYIKYPVSFEKDKREVTISGRAYFDVSKSKIPFIVNTTDMKIEVLGTSFDVESTKMGNTTSVILVEGSVKISTEGLTKIIEPNERIILNHENRNISISNVDAKTLTLWKDGILVLRDNSINEIVDALCSWYGVEIINNTSISENDKFNGRFDREDLKSAMETIALGAKVVYRVEEGKLILEDSK
ncbi:MAG: FecR family protein [Bacteroidales bacterium]